MINFNEKNGILTIENEFITFQFDTNSGFMNFMDKKKQNHVISNGLSSISYDSRDVDSLDEAEIKWEISDFEDENGKGKSLNLNFLSKIGKPQLKLIIKLFENKPFIFLQNSIINDLGRNIRIKSFSPIELRETSLSNIDLGTSIDDWKILAGQYQSWAPIKLVGPFEKDFRPKVPNFIAPGRTVFLSNPDEEREKYEQVGDNYIIIKNLKTQSNMLFGFLTFENQLSQIIFRFNKKKRALKRLKTRSQADNIILEPNEELSSELLMINFVTTPIENLILYADLIKKLNKTIQWDKVPTGYCTWYIYFHKINEEECIKNLNFLAERRDPIPITYFQLDDGYQKTIGDWEANEKFPDGMKKFVDKIEKKGFKAGLWLAPFFVGKKSMLYKKHPNWILRNNKGKPVVVTKNPAWGYRNTIYALDCSHPEVHEWLRELFTKITKEWGFKCIKIDFIFGACATTNYYNKKMTRAQVYRKGLEIIREAIGPDVLLLGCGAPIGPSIGLVNAMRVSPDTHTSWDPWYAKLLRKRIRLHGVPCVVNAMRNNMRAFFMHKKFWINDPDCLMVRLENTNLSEEEVKSEITCIGLLNGYYFLSDNFSYVDDKQVSLVKKFFPFDGNTAIPIDLFESEMPQILDLPIKKEFGDWHVVGIFNWGNKTKSIELNFEDLGLAKDKEYHVFEFWKRKYYGIYKRKITFRNVKKHTCELIAIKKVESKPQILSSTLHFMQGFVEIKRCIYDEDSKKLKINLEFSGKNDGSLFLFNPEDNEWQIDNTKNTKLIKKSKNVYKLEVNFENNLEITISC
ncbi:MAG: alpha-galactosidase [Candidatus Helarchaeota archaeon]|nr:alpha-galactosidase [Candidatus Helarchaeota archaeon]